MLILLPRPAVNALYLAVHADRYVCDLILDDLPHVPTALLSDEIAKRTITLMAPSKTYNVPGLGTSIAIIPDAQLRALSGHKSTAMVHLYAKATMKQRREGARKRRDARKAP